MSLTEMKGLKVTFLIARVENHYVLNATELHSFTAEHKECIPTSLWLSWECVTNAIQSWQALAVKRTGPRQHLAP